MKMLTVVAIEDKVSERVQGTKGNAGRYRVITLEGAGQMLGRDEMGMEHIVQIPKRKTSITVWVDSPIPNRTEPDFLYDAQVGQKVPGQIVEREVRPYFIPSDNGPEMKEGVKGRHASTASVLVIGNTEDVEDFRLQILKSFRQRNFFLKGEGEAGTPANSYAAALVRPQSKTEEASPFAQVPYAVAEKAREDGDPHELVDYSNASAEANEDEAANAR